MSMIVRTLMESATIAALVWCIFNEDKLVAFEEKIFRRSK